jgi:RNA polymerase sigma-70 factor (ECF subfamily)
VEGKTYKEIAESLGIPVRTVTREIQNALAQLRKSLHDYLPVVLLMLTLPR